VSESASGARAGGDLVFIGDVHLDASDTHLEAFLAFLESLGSTTSRLVFLGDLFNLWIGRREMEQPHQHAVTQQLEMLRRGGMVVRYVEGNRDYRIASAYVGSALDEASLDGVAEEMGGRRLWAIHGDLANPGDRHYRRWRRLSRSPLSWHLFSLVPRGRRMRVADYLERKLRKSNPEFKRRFPEREVRAYGASFLAQGYDTVVLGHFHVERDLRVDSNGNPGRILVLPEWRESRRHLRVDPDGNVAFVDSG
jgi:UDP-2,3-diacylglucosamine hydrolase